jgi:glutamate--cysteine ligase
VVASGKTFADRLLDRYHGEWHGDVAHVYEEFSF